MPSNPPRRRSSFKGRCLFLCQCSSHGCGAEILLLPGASEPIRGRVLINRKECSRHAKDDVHQSGFKLRGSISDEDCAYQSDDDSDDSDSHPNSPDSRLSEDEASEVLHFNKLQITDEVPSSLVINRLVDEIDTKGVLSHDSRSLVFKLQEASYAAKCKNTVQPDAQLLELVYSNPDNLPFLACQSWLQKAIRELNGLALDVTHHDDLCVQRDALLVQLNHKLSDLAALRLLQWEEQFGYRDASAKTATFDVDTSKSS